MSKRDESFESSNPPRRFVYRSARQEPTPTHPLRRATDTPHRFQGIPGPVSPHTQLLRFRVYLKVN